MAIANPGNQMIDVASLPPDLALMRIENDNIQAMAVARPRDLEAVKKDILGQLQAFPAVAEDLIYSRPVGKNDDGEEQFARNLSVRAAEMLAEAYGFNRVAAKTTLVDEDHAQVEATFVDYQRGRIWTESRPVSRSYKKKGGAIGYHPTDRFLGIVCQAERSKAIREAILRCVPPGLKHELFVAADKMMAKLLTDDQIAKIVDSFKTKGIVYDQLVKLIGRPGQKGWTLDDRRKLLGLWKAIEDGEVSVDEVFGASKGPAAQTGAAAAKSKPAAGGVSADDLLNPKGAAEERKTDAQPDVGDDEPLPPNPKGQVGPEKPEEAAEEPADDEPRYEDTGEEENPPLPEWCERFAIELQECEGIRQIKALGERYAAMDGMTTEDVEWINDRVSESQEQVRRSRGGRSNQ